MEQQNSIYYSSQAEDSSKPRFYTTNSYTHYQSQQGQDMLRHLSSDSGYHSNTSHQSDDFCYADQSPITVMSTIPASPSRYYENNVTASQTLQSQYFESSQMYRSRSNPSSQQRSTPESLGWVPGSDLLKLYKFVVQKGKEPYLELLLGCSVTPDTPERVYLDPPKVHQKNAFPCQYPACNDPKIFKRPADLERHYRNVHASLDQREQYPCDYPNCQKGRGPFTRKDHFRDHLRDYHKEDIGSAKGEKQYERKKWLKLQEAWVAERNISAKWWRCQKCLQRVYVSDAGFDCPDCKVTLDSERVDRIRAKARAQALAASTGMEDVQYGVASSTTTYPANCVDCGDTGWIWNELEHNWDACQACPPQTYKYEEEWNNSGATYSSNN